MRTSGFCSSTVQDLLAHAQHSVDLGDPKPVQNIRHESLETHVFDAGYIFGPLEVVGCTIFSTFPRVVHDCIMLEAVTLSNMHRMLLEACSGAMGVTYGTGSG